jgi:hypothetical protein
MLGRIVYSQRCPIDDDPIFWVEEKIEMLAKNFPMKGCSFNILKNFGCKR